MGDTEEQVLRLPDAAAWADWLRAEHARSPGVWLAIARVGSGQQSPSYAEALAEALCWGWIDARRRSLDETHWLQRFTPRTARGRWSQVNVEHALRLIEEGRMQPPGLREVERARADGRWEAAYPPQREATVPPDLAEALAASPRAAAFFATLDSRNRYSVLHRIGAAKRPQTRAQRIARFVAMLEAGQKFHP